MKPYYENELVTIYHGDCLEILPELEPVDLVLTDPPYGIGQKWVGGKNNGWSQTDDEKEIRNEWDKNAPDRSTFEKICSISKYQIIWGGNYFELPSSRCWLVWNKPERGFTLAEAELAWTNADNVVRVFDWKRHCENRIHPTQKPLSLFQWCLSLSWSKISKIILDPFLGSGTTAVACMQLNRKCIGIEIEEKYCEIAVKRCEQAKTGLTPGEQEAEQMLLFDPKKKEGNNNERDSGKETQSRGQSI